MSRWLRAGARQWTARMSCQTTAGPRWAVWLPSRCRAVLHFKRPLSSRMAGDGGCVRAAALMACMSGVP